VRELLVPAVTNRKLAVSVAATVLVADQLTKWWAFEELADGPVRLFGDFLQFRLVRNSGAAFGTLQNAGVLLAIIAVVAILLLLRVSAETEHRYEAVIFGLVLGGAAGNLGDRVFRGAGFFDGRVVDWIDFSFWPTFNVADSAITIAVLMAVATAFRAK
jgi:signal peptidase II